MTDPKGLGRSRDAAEVIEDLLLEHSGIIAPAIQKRNSPIYDGSADSSGMSTLASRIIALRKARGMSTTELARACGVSQPSMHNIESGKTKTLRGKTLAELVRVLGATPEIILGHGAFSEGQLREAELMSLWRALSDEQHNSILSIMRGLVAHATIARRQDPPPGPKTQATAHGRRTTLT